MPVIPIEKWRGLIVKFHKRQQAQVTSTLDFTCQFALAASAVPGLTTGLDLARLANEAIQSVDVFVIKAATFRAVVAAGAATATTTAHSAFIITVTTFAIRAIPAITSTTKAAAAKTTGATTTKATAAETTRAGPTTTTFVVVHVY
jgi:hypothetical protein